jgi:hypothetical protein
MLTADRRLEGQVRVRWHEAFRTSNGGIPVRLLTTVVGAHAGAGEHGATLPLMADS